MLEIVACIDRMNFYFQLPEWVLGVAKPLRRLQIDLSEQGICIDLCGISDVNILFSFICLFIRIFNYCFSFLKYCVLYGNVKWNGLCYIQLEKKTC